MPWCPNCKLEYQEGFTECSDCKTKLVDSLEESIVTFVPFFQAGDKKTAEKLAKFFEYSDLKCDLRYEEETELYIVAIPPKSEKQAKKLYQAFYYVEAELLAEANKGASNTMPSSENSVEAADEASEDRNEYYNADQEADSDEAETAYEADIPSDDASGYERKEEAVYVMKADQYKDLSGTVTTFLIFGIAGLVFVLLNIMDILHVFNSWIQNTVMGIVFLLLIYVALSTNKKAKLIKSEIGAENKLTEDINNWLTQHITESFLSSIHNDDMSEELNYIKFSDLVKELLNKEFGPQNLSYLDRLIDDFYDSTFDREA